MTESGPYARSPIPNRNSCHAIQNESRHKTPRQTPTQGIQSKELGNQLGPGPLGGTTMEGLAGTLAADAGGARGAVLGTTPAAKGATTAAAAAPGLDRGVLIVDELLGGATGGTRGRGR